MNDDTPRFDLVLDLDGRTVLRQGVLPGSPRPKVPRCPIPGNRDSGEQPEGGGLFDLDTEATGPRLPGLEED